jgi:hypothetical protein
MIWIGALFCRFVVPKVLFNRRILCNVFHNVLKGWYISRLSPSSTTGQIDSHKEIFTSSKEYDLPWLIWRNFKTKSSATCTNSKFCHDCLLALLRNNKTRKTNILQWYSYVAKDQPIRLRQNATQEIPSLYQPIRLQKLTSSATGSTG